MFERYLAVSTKATASERVRVEKLIRELSACASKK
jgi:hypothetical protein